jgi:hypothetical protein
MTKKTLLKRVGVVLLMLATASFWITPLHEAAHWVPASVFGLNPEVRLYWDAPILAGSVRYDRGTPVQGFLTTAGPWYLLYLPGAVALPFLTLFRTRRAMIARLFLALLVGQGGLYTLLGLYRQCGSCDSWNMVQIGIPSWVFYTFGSMTFAMALWVGVEFLRKGVRRYETTESEVGGSSQ